MRRERKRKKKILKKRREKYLLSVLPSASDGHEKEDERIGVKLLHVTWMFSSHQNTPLEPLVLPVERKEE